MLFINFNKTCPKFMKTEQKQKTRIDMVIKMKKEECEMVSSLLLISRLSMIGRVNVVPNRTVVFHSD